MPVLVKLRAKELDPAGADAAIAETRARVVALLNSAAAPDGHAPEARDRFADFHGSAAMEVLGRRLTHIEAAAAKVARLAARPAIEEL